MTVPNFRWRVHPLFLTIVLAAIWFGYSREVLLLVIVLLLHELAHIGMASAFGFHIAELEIMPYGGAAKIVGLEQADPAKEMIVALAGPVCNLSLLAVGLLWFKVLPPGPVLGPLWISANTTLAFVNLLPALPLDGGRAVRGIIASRYGHQAAQAILLRLGRLVACLLVVTGIVSALFGYLIWTLPFLGVFLWLRTGDEDWSHLRAMRDLWQKNEIFQKRGSMEVRYLLVPIQTEVRELHTKMRPDYYHVVVVADDDMHIVGSFGENILLQALLDGRSRARVTELIQN